MPSKGNDRSKPRLKSRSSAGAAAPSTTSNRSKAHVDGPLTRGGWTPVGTAAKRRVSQSERGTERGQRTRSEIVAAARRVFERNGYLDVNIDDIVTEAGVARGSFYTYFPTKLAVFKVLAATVGRSIDEGVTTHPEDERLDPIDALDRTNRRYIQTYREHAAIYGLIEQLATIDDELQRIRRASRHHHVDRVTVAIHRWQDQGVADPSIEASTTAAALVSMMSNFCYWWMVGGDHYDENQATATLTEIWVRALDLRRRPRPSWLTQKVSH